MIEKLNIEPLSEDQIAALDTAGHAIMGIGKVLISTEYATNGKMMAMIATKSGKYVSAYGATLSEALNGAIEKYEAWVPGADPITSAVDAVNIIRQRLADGEDVDGILRDINVA